MQHKDIPPPQSATLVLTHSHKLLLIFHTAEGRRLSWTKDTVGLQHAQGYLQMMRVKSNHNLKVTSPIFYQTNCTMTAANIKTNTINQ